MSSTAALRAGEEHFRRLLERSPQGIHVQRDGVTLFANAALARMLGQADASALIGTAIPGLTGPAVPGPAPGEAEAPGEAIPACREVRSARRDGTPLWIEVQASEIVWEERPATLATVVDVTERRRAEASLREHGLRLLQSQKMEAIGQLAGGVAHDFNNILTVITGRCDLLLRRLAPDDRGRRDVELIRKAADRAAGLTHQLLAFSRKQVLRPAPLDLNAVIDALTPMLQRLIGEHITVDTRFEPELGPVWADRAQVEQIILNIAVNARDAIQGSGRLVLETSSLVLDDAFVADHPGARVGPHALLAITDSGSGMSEEVQAHLFEPFFTTKEVGKGTGLGLASVYGIVRQHQGYIAVVSAPGHGTTVQVYLPRAVEPVSVSASAPESAQGSETVLVVEDEIQLRDLAREVLSAAGYTVLDAGRPSEALALAEQHDAPLHLVLTDVVMPEMSGRELADRLVARWPGLRVLYMSGYADEAIAHHGVLEPGLAFLAKPFTADALAVAVRDALDTQS